MSVPGAEHAKGDPGSSSGLCMLWPVSLACMAVARPLISVDLTAWSLYLEQFMACYAQKELPTTPIDHVMAFDSQTTREGSEQKTQHVKSTLFINCSARRSPPSRPIHPNTSSCTPNK